MFDQHSTDRLIEWKKFRTQLEVSDTPFKDVADFWSRAPFVSPYLDPNSPVDWPDPWHLIIDGKFDELAISLGMLYTLKLTDRFMKSKYEIHMSMLDDKKRSVFFLVVDNKHVLNLTYKQVLDIKDIGNVQSNLLWSTEK